MKAITKMKTGKAAGPSGIVVEMLKVILVQGWSLIGKLASSSTFTKGKVMLWREVTTEVSNSLIMS